MKSQLHYLLVISFVLCIGGSLIIYRQLERQYASTNAVTCSYIVKITLNQLLLNLSEAETNERSYLLSHDPDFLTAYQSAIHKARSIITILDSETTDNPRQKDNLSKLRRAFNQDILALHASVLLPAGEPPLPDIADATMERTIAIFDKFRAIAYAMLDTEDGLLQQRVHDKDSLVRMNPLLFLVIFSLVMLLVFFVYFRLKKETALRIDSQNNTAELQLKEEQAAGQLALLNEQLATRNDIFVQAEQVAMIGSYTWNVSTGEMEISDNLYRLLGYEPQEFQPTVEQLLQLTHPEEKDRTMRNGSFSLEWIIQSEIPCRFVTKEGFIRYLRATGSHVFRPGQQIIVGTFQDVTRDIELRQNLEQNDNFIRSILDIAPSVITIFDMEKQRIIFSSQRYLPSLGFQVDTPSGFLRLLSEMIHPEDKQPALDYFSTIGSLRDKEVSEFEYRICGINGNYNYLLTRNTPYKRNEKNEVTQFLSATIDITEKVRAQMEVKAKTEALLVSRYMQQSALRFKELADSMPQIVWTADPAGVLDYFNQRWYNYLDLSPGTPAGLHLAENMHPDDIGPYFDGWNASLSTGRPFQVEFRFKDHKTPGEFCWFLAKALAIYDTDGSIMKWHGTFTDINDLKLAQLAVQRLVKEKEDFISIASHELKTPVTTLKGSIQLLEQQSSVESFSEDTSLLISMAGRQINKLSRMVGDLLDVAKMDTERLLLIKADFLLKDAIDASLEQVGYLSRRRSITVTGTTDIRLHAHKERIEQVITNFLSNALKYSSAESPISISASTEDNHVKVTVTDSGIGIPASKLPYVFDRFFRVEASSNRFSGLGLGLYIAAEIISLHEGRIGVDSEPGKGSSFWFALPLEGDR